MSDAWFQVLPSHADGDARDAVVCAGSGETLSASETRCPLRVEGTPDDQVTLNNCAGWTLNPNDMVGDNTYNVWNHTSAPAQLPIDSRVIEASSAVARRS